MSLLLYSEHSILPVLYETHHDFASSPIHAFSHINYTVLYEFVRSKDSCQTELPLVCLHRKYLLKNRKISY